LRGADLQEIQLVRVDLSDADLRGAQVLWLHLMEAVVVHGTNLCGARLDDSHSEVPISIMSL
ncbi:MAG: pentapeptide repeat-containing protein, partial [Ktedonobacteraceae bacterium]|nr:pentapeptide repeat-containing protein [Ktedonobacteraceae bacterium]